MPKVSAKRFTEIYFDNFLKTALGITVLLSIYLISAHFGIALYVVAGAAISAVIALILTLFEYFRKRQVAPTE